MIIAGSFATATFLESSGTRPWWGNDINVWTTCWFQAAEVADMYVRGVLRPMRYTYFSEQHHDFPYSIGSDFEDSSSGESYDFLELARRRMGPQSPDWNLRTLQAAVRTWLQDELEEAMETIRSRNPALTATFIEQQLRATVDHLPRHIEDAPWRPMSTIALQPRTSPYPNTRSVTICPINIRQVSAYDDEDLGAAVCSGFDVTACCVELRVDGNDRFTLRHHYSSDASVLNRVLELCPVAFARSREGVYAQMDRIAKYVERGFQWAA